MHAGKSVLYGCICLISGATPKDHKMLAVIISGPVLFAVIFICIIKRKKTRSASGNELEVPRNPIFTGNCIENFQFHL